MRETGQETVSVISQDTQGETRAPKMTQREAAFLLERGPYVARLAAQEKLLAYAKAITTGEREHGPNLPAYVIEELADSVEVARQQLAEFEATQAPFETVAEDDVAEIVSERDESTSKPIGKSAVDSTVELRIVSTSSRSDEDWRERALCAQTDPEAFHPEKGGSTREAKKVCQSCEVREECLHWALDTKERYGIWGGLSERERRKLLKKAV